MMKSLSLLFLVVWFSLGNTFAQKYYEMPLLIKTTPKTLLPRLEIILPCVKDTVKIGVTVMVRFDNVFSDSVKLTTPKEIYVLGFGDTERQKSITNKEIGFEDINFIESDFTTTAEAIEPTSVSSSNICIREALDAQFNIWLKEQPYSEMYGIENFYGHNGFALSYAVFLIPE